MLRKLGIVLIVVLAVSGMAMATVIAPKVPIQNLPVLNGTETYDNVPFILPSDIRHGGATLDTIGARYQAGTTWYDYQHNGTAGKTISVDTSGYVHIVWMNGLSATQNPRHVYYNVWDPTSETFVLGATGGQINASTRGGYISCAVTPDGFCFPAFHEILSGLEAHANSAIDFLPRTGAYTTTPQPCWLNNMQLIWPKIAMSTDGKIHLVSTFTPLAPGDPQEVAYTRGNPVFVDGYGDHIDWEMVPNGGSNCFWVFDTVQVIAPDIAASKISNRLVIAWSEPRDPPASDSSNQYNNDLMIMVSEDAGLNWGPKQNITNFDWPDYECVSGDTLVCDRDTFRLYTDCSVIFDTDDNIHVAFTTCNYYSLEGTINVWFSYIFHWSEDSNVFSPVAIGDFDSTTWTAAPGAWQRDAQRPSLSVDWTTGNLYCSVWWYDSLHISASGFPQADAWVTVSTDNGVNWAQPTNVTETGDVEGAPAGQCWGERDPTIADHVTYDSQGDGWLHMSYVLDKDAGAIIQTPPEGVATLNPVYYQRIPVDSIATSPLLDNLSPVLRYDSTGWPGHITASDDIPTELPEAFALYQNYPNPFNPTTSIQFDLARTANVTLTVFNVGGQEVATLLDNRAMNAGVQVVEFDGADLASGVYIYRINVDGVTASKKMVLMK